MELEYKRVPFAVKEVVDVSDGGWEVAGYASTFGGEADFYGDVIMPGAFAASIASYLPKFLFEHYEPIGKTLEIREDDHGLFGRWSIVDTRAGTDAYKLARAEVLDSLSIGFFAEEYAYREDGARLLIKIDLPEVSAVAIPANRHAVITDVKHQAGGVRPFAAHASDVRVAVRSWVDRVRSGSEMRNSDGKTPFSDERRASIADMSGSLRSAAEELDQLVATTAPAPLEGRHDIDALRARLVRLGALSSGGDPR